MEKNIWPGWETVKLIGRGSFGAVYEIQRDVFGDVEKAALKVISIPQNASDIDEMYSDGYDDESITSTFQSHLKSIVAEYSLMRKMNGSANIVNCDDIRYVQHDDGIGWDIFIKMELLTPLAKALPADIPEETVIKVAKDMCAALELCQKHNIVHRDIKPQNIFLSPNGDYKLGDFGIAKTVEKTMGGTKIGTYKYMAPEVYNNQPYGTEADVYSLGLVLYWMLNERRTPFLPLPPAQIDVKMDEAARLRRFQGEKLPPPAHGNEGLKKIVLKACAYDPKDRYATAAEMLRDLSNGYTDAKLLRKQEEERRRKEEEERLRKEAEEAYKKAEEERKRQEAERLAREKAEREGKERERKEREWIEQERLRKEKENETGKSKSGVIIGAICVLLVLIIGAILAAGSGSNTGNNQPNKQNGSSMSGNVSSSNPTDITNPPIQTSEQEVFDKSDGVEGYEGGEVTITLIHKQSNAMTSILDTYIKKFMQIYPSVIVRQTRYDGSSSDLEELILESMSTDDMYNMVIFPDVIDSILISKAVPLESFIDSQKSVVRLDGNAESMGLSETQKSYLTVDSSQNFIPLATSCELLYYNKTFFEQNNLSVPTTWDEMEAVCEQIKRLNPASIPLGIDNTSSLFITLCEQSGDPCFIGEAPYFTFNTEKNRSFTKMFNEWYQKGYFTTLDFFGAYTSSLFTATEGVRNYMSIASSAGATYSRPEANENGSYPFEVGIASIPQVDPDDPRVMADAKLCMYLFDSGDPQELAASWLLLKYLLTNVEFQAELSMRTGYTPATYAVVETDFYRNYLANADGGNGISALALNMCMEQIHAYFIPPIFEGCNSAMKQMGELFGQCVYDSQNLILEHFDMAAEMYKEQ